jgi:prophage regulatory protein
MTDQAKNQEFHVGAVYVTDTDLAKRWSVSRPTIWRWHREDSSFPRAVKLGANCSRWKLADIEAWEASRGAAA